MRVVELSVQLQMVLEDGSKVIFATPPLMAKPELCSESSIRDAVLDLGFTPQQVQEQMLNGVKPGTDEMLSQVESNMRKRPGLYTG